MGHVLASDSIVRRGGTQNVDHNHLSLVICVQDISGGCGSMFRIKAVAGDFSYVSPAPLHAGQLPVCLPQLPVCPSKRRFAWVSKPLCTPASTGRCSFRQDWCQLLLAPVEAPRAERGRCALLEGSCGICCIWLPYSIARASSRSRRASAEGGSYRAVCHDRSITRPGAE